MQTRFHEYVRTPAMARSWYLLASHAIISTGGQPTHLYYDAYPAMAEPVLASIAAEAAERWDTRPRRGPPSYRPA